jgi:hypothetical protein
MALSTPTTGLLKTLIADLQSEKLEDLFHYKLNAGFIFIRVLTQSKKVACSGSTTTESIATNNCPSRV